MSRALRLAIKTFHAKFAPHRCVRQVCIDCAIFAECSVMFSHIRDIYDDNTSVSYFILRAFSQALPDISILHLIVYLSMYCVSMEEGGCRCGQEPRD